MNLRTVLLAVVAAGSLSACAPSTGDTPTTTAAPTTVAPTTTVPADARTEPWATSLDNPEGSLFMTEHYCAQLGGNYGYVYTDLGNGHGTCYAGARNKIYTW